MHAEVEGSRLEDHQIVTEVLLLLIGGDETTRHTLSGGTRQLLRHPDQHQRLANDLELLPNAIEEMLRWTAPVKNMARTITADTEFHGARLKEGEKMILLFESAWKIIWLAVVALPKLAADDLDPATREVLSSCLWVVIILAVVPWRYVWQHYVTAKGDRWR